MLHVLSRGVSVIAPIPGKVAINAVGRVGRKSLRQCAIVTLAKCRGKCRSGCDRQLKCIRTSAVGAN